MIETLYLTIAAGKVATIGARGGLLDTVDLGGLDLRKGSKIPKGTENLFYLHITIRNLGLDSISSID